MKNGGFTFVLHSHLPYCRQAGRWPHGEEWIHEAAAETYVPLLNALYDLREEQVPFRLTLGLTPILTEQLADPLIIDNFIEYLDEKIAAAGQDIERFSSEQLTRERDEARQAARLAAAAQAPRPAQTEPIETETEEADEPLTPTANPPAPALLKGKAALEAASNIRQAAAQELAAAAGDQPLNADLAPLSTGITALDLPPVVEPAIGQPTPDEQDTEPVPAEQRHYLAIYYRDWYSNIKDSFINRYQRNLVGAFRDLQDAGLIEIITCAATHGYLPLLARDSSIYGQLATAVSSYERHFGRKPRAIWLPECAYRPAYYATNEAGQQYLKPGLEDFLVEQGISLFFCETHTIEGGVPVGKAAGDTLIGPYSYVTRRYVIPAAEELPKTDNTTSLPYWVVRPDVAVMGRNNRTGMQVWSSESGYPGEKDYREFHSKDSGSGMQYWRITGPKVDLSQKDFYHPEWAAQRVPEHATHFISLVEEQTQSYFDSAGKPGIIACNYDTELFGHWWFEGVDWLKAVLKGLAYSEVVEITTASDWLEKHPPEIVLAIPESSWGQQGTHFVWMNEENEWIWGPIHQAERRMEQLVEKFGSSQDTGIRSVMQQTARELLLLESSDWPFLITTGQAKDYAIERFEQHTQRFQTLADGLEATNGSLDPAVLASAREYERLDNPFPQIEPQDFAYREKSVAE